MSHNLQMAAPADGASIFQYFPNTFYDPRTSLWYSQKFTGFSGTSPQYNFRVTNTHPALSGDRGFRTSELPAYQRYRETYDPENRSDIFTWAAQRSYPDAFYGNRPKHRVKSTYDLLGSLPFRPKSHSSGSYWFQISRNNEPHFSDPPYFQTRKNTNLWKPGYSRDYFGNLDDEGGGNVPDQHLYAFYQRHHEWRLELATFRGVDEVIDDWYYRYLSYKGTTFSGPGTTLTNSPSDIKEMFNTGTTFDTYRALDRTTWESMMRTGNSKIDWLEENYTGYYPLGTLISRDEQRIVFGDFQYIDQWYYDPPVLTINSIEEFSRNVDPSLGILEDYARRGYVIQTQEGDRIQYTFNPKDGSFDIYQDAFYGGRTAVRTTWRYNPDQYPLQRLKAPFFPSIQDPNFDTALAYKARLHKFMTDPSTRGPTLGSFLNELERSMFTPITFDTSAIWSAKARLREVANNNYANLDWNFFLSHMTGLLSERNAASLNVKGMESVLSMTNSDIRSFVEPFYSGDDFTSIAAIPQNKFIDIVTGWAWAAINGFAVEYLYAKTEHHAGGRQSPQGIMTFQGFNTITVRARGVFPYDIGSDKSHFQVNQKSRIAHPLDIKSSDSIFGVEIVQSVSGKQRQSRIKRWRLNRIFNFRLRPDITFKPERPSPMAGRFLKLISHINETSRPIRPTILHQEMYDTVESLRNVTKQRFWGLLPTSTLSQYDVQAPTKALWSWPDLHHALLELRRFPPGRRYDAWRRLLVDHPEWESLKTFDYVVWRIDGRDGDQFHTLKQDFEPDAPLSLPNQP